MHLVFSIMIPQLLFAFGLGWLLEHSFFHVIWSFGSQCT